MPLTMKGCLPKQMVEDNSVYLEDRSDVYNVSVQICDCVVVLTTGVVHHISRLSIQDRVLDLSVKKDNGSVSSQSVDRPLPASTSAAGSGLSVQRTDVPDKPSSPLPHLYVFYVTTLTCNYLLSAFSISIPVTQ